MGFQTSFDFEKSYKNMPMDNILNENLSRISTDEIKSFVSRLNFYIQHFDILTRKSQTYKGENKVNFLKKLKFVLMDEMESRKAII